MCIGTKLCYCLPVCLFLLRTEYPDTERYIETDEQRQRHRPIHRVQNKETDTQRQRHIYKETETEKQAETHFPILHVAVMWKRGTTI